MWSARLIVLWPQETLRSGRTGFAAADYCVSCMVENRGNSPAGHNGFGPAAKASFSAELPGWTQELTDDDHKLAGDRPKVLTDNRVNVPWWCYKQEPGYPHNKY